MKKLLLFVAVTIYAAQAFSQTTHYVSSTGTNSGTSWTTIKAAITAASSDDIIELAAETFTEKNITFPTISTVITPKSITIKGAGIGQTIIQAYATANNTPAASSSVFNLDGLYSSAITVTLQDMTIQNGFNSSNGGGIRVTNTGTVAPILNFTNLKIANNTGLAGGGIYISGYATTSITGCNITGNTGSSTTAGNGGGIYITPGTNKLLSATIKNSTISLNTSGYLGGGLMVQCSGDNANPNTNQLNHSLTIENTTFYKNSCITATKSGGGIEFRQSGSTSTNCTHTVTLNHCTIVGNTTNGGSGGDGVCFENNYNTTLIMNNSVVMGNSGATTYPSQIGVLASSQAKLLNGGVTNNIMGIYIGTGSANTITSANNNKLDAVIGDLAFPTLDNNALSADATPVLKIGSSSIAKNYVTTNAISLTKDQLGNTRDSSPDAGAYELPLVIAATPSTGGVVTSGTGNYYTGGTATLIATPSSGYRFINWTENGSEVSTSASYNFTVSGDRTLVANFDLGTGIKTNIATNQFVVAKESIVSNVSGTIQIYSISGKIIKNQTMTVGQIIPLTAGSYIVRVVTNNEVFVKKISF